MKQILGILLAFVLFSACGKEENYVPDYPVNFSRPLTDPSLSRLSSPNGAVTFNNYGVAGIIIFRRADGQYVAFDRCSTVNPLQKNAIVVDDPSLTATDPVSGAIYSLYDGSPVKAPAKTSLKQYTVNIAGNTLRVFN